MAEVAFSLGSNIGNRKRHIRQAEFALTDYIGEIITKSSIYETAPWGGVEDQGLYLNSVVIINTQLNAYNILKRINKIEYALGRVRKIKWDSRIIDIDILYYDDQIYNTPMLTIPHKMMPQRMFALIPLKEVRPEWIHPLSQKPIDTLIEECNDPSAVVRVVEDFE